MHGITPGRGSRAGVNPKLPPLWSGKQINSIGDFDQEDEMLRPFCACIALALVAFLAGSSAAQTDLPPITKGTIRIELEPLASGLTAPNLVQAAPDGTARLFVTDQDGRVHLLHNGAVSPTPFLDIRNRLVTLSTGFDERGLLGVAFHPGYADPLSPGYRKLYTYSSEPLGGPADFTVPLTSGSFNHQSVVAEWQVDANNPNVVDLSTRREIMRVDEPQSNHNGGMMAFRPTDGYLYISLGDGGGANDTGNGHNPATGNGQDLTTVLGKVLRIDPVDPALTTGSSNPASANGKYRVPANNPFSSNPNAVDEIFAYGFRNPWRFSFDSMTSELYVADVGQRRVEEINRVEPGLNYGWATKEGTFLFNRSDGTIAPDPNPDPNLIDPIAQYANRNEAGQIVDGIAIIGGTIYRGSMLPQLQGMYVFGDWSRSFGSPNGRLFYLDPDDPDGIIRELIIGASDESLSLFLLGFGEDAEGELYILGSTTTGPTVGDGVVLRIVPEPGTLSLLASGLLLLARRNRVKRCRGGSLANSRAGNALAMQSARGGTGERR